MLLFLVIATTLGGFALAKTFYDRWQLALVDRAVATVEKAETKKAS
jgi:hypothetical protein